jgi:hypothetical protein
MNTQLTIRKSVLRNAALGVALAALIASGAGAGALPAEHTQGVVTYMTGGIGLDESQAMKQAAPGYSLEIVLAKKTEDGRGTYLAGNRVVIKDQAGETLLDTRAEGPFVLATLPPGRYTVTAWQDDVAKSQAVRVVAGQHRRIVFLW